jgi:pentatricopeptide repeat protein
MPPSGLAPKATRQRRPQSHFSQIPQRGLGLEVISYSTSFRACSTGHLTEKAGELFFAVAAARFEPEVVSYSSVINVCSTGRKTEKALELFSLMQQRCLEPYVITAAEAPQWGTRASICSVSSSSSNTATISPCEKSQQ